MRYLTLIVSFIFTSVLFGQKAGLLDSTYGVNGIWEKQVDGPLIGHKLSLAIQEDNKKIIAGVKMINGKAHAMLIRLNPDGGLDETFGKEGEVTHEFNRNASLANLKVQQDGKLLTSGSIIQNDLDLHDILIMRYTPQGTLDSGFMKNGYFTYHFGNGYSSSFMNRILFNYDGKIILGGVIKDSITSYLGIIKLEMNGSFDSTFGNKGVALVEYGRPRYLFELSDIGFQSDGKIVCCGDVYDDKNRLFLGICRLDTNGHLDPTFGNGGIFLYNYDKRFEGVFSNSSEVVNNNKIVVGCFIVEKKQASDPEVKLGILKFNGDGNPDLSFGNQGLKTIKLGSEYYSRDAIIKILDSNTILVGGLTVKNIENPPREFYYQLTKLGADGNIDAAFGNNGTVLTRVPQNVAPESIMIEKENKIILAGATANFFEPPSEFYIHTARYHSGINIGVLDFKFTESEIINYPNPIKERTILEYTLKNQESISIYLTDVTGRRIKEWEKGATQSEGEHKIELNFNSEIAPGTYFLTVSNGKANQSVKVFKTN